MGDGNGIVRREPVENLAGKNRGDDKEEGEATQKAITAKQARLQRGGVVGHGISPTSSSMSPG